MRWYIIKYSAVGLLMLASREVLAQDTVPAKDTSHKITWEEKDEQRFLHHKERYRDLWDRLIPTHTKLQYAGSIGLLSGAVGWDYGRREQWETDFFVGIIPRFSGSDWAFTITLKQTYVPWHVPLDSRWSFEPLMTGLFVNSVLDDDFWGREPDRYPNNYYKFSTRVRFHAFLGQGVTWNVNPRMPSRKLTLYYEISSCDLYIISSASNRCVKFTDILSLAFGLKMVIL